MLSIFQTTQDPTGSLHRQTSCQQEGGQDKGGKMTEVEAALS